MRLPMALAALIAAVTSTGCAKNEFFQRLARFELESVAESPRPQAVTVPAPEDGLYKVRWSPDASAPPYVLTTCVGTRRQLRKGDPIGFTTGPDGRVVAIAGDERIPLTDLPDDAAYCVWHHAHVERALDAAQIGRAVGTASVYVMAAAVEGITNSYLDDDDDDCDDGRRSPQHHCHRDQTFHASKKPVTVP